MTRITTFLSPLLGQLACRRAGPPATYGKEQGAHEEREGLWHAFRHELPELLKTTFLLASALFILEHAGYLNWLDNAMLRLAIHVHTTSVQATPTDSQPLPVVVIDDNAYESTFFEKSPLDPDKMASLIDLIAAQKPAQLVIDLDLSPTADQAGTPRALDRVLAETARSTHVLMVLPGQAIGDAAWQVKKRWLDSMCRAGVDFAYDTLQTNQGTFIRYDSEMPTLGVQAAKWQKGEAEHEATLCGQILDIQDKLIYGGMVNLDPTNPEDPLNYGKSRSVQTISAVWSDGKPAFGTPLPAGETVFLGGAWGSGDHYTTPVGYKYGVEIHALAYQSTLHPVHIQRILPVVLDIVLGAAIGFLLIRIWKGLVYTSPPFYLGHALGPWLIVTVILSILGILVWAMDWMLSHQIWLNAAPMILGMLIDSHNTAIESLAKSNGQHSPKPSTRLDCLVHRLLVIAYLAITSCALYIMTHE